MMSKGSEKKPQSITFQTCDKNLLDEIIAYQEKNGLPTFVSAVRQLCNFALQEKNKQEKL